MRIINNKKLYVAWFLVLLCNFIVGLVSAAEREMTMAGGAVFTTNVNQTPVGEPDFYTTFLWGGSYKEDSPRLKLEANGSVLASFLHRVGTDSITPQGEVSALAVLSKERLDWELQDRINLVRKDILGTDTPSNLELTNVIRTGPDFIARLGKLNRLRVEAKYEKSNFQVSTSKNSTKHIGVVRLEHDLSKFSQTSLNYESRRSYTTNGYQQYRAYLGYNRTSPDKLLELRAGETRVTSEGFPEFHDPFIDVRAVYKQNSRYSWTATYSQKFSDLGDAILEPDILADPLVSGSGFFYQYSSGLAFNYKYADILASLRLGNQDRYYKLLGGWDKSIGAAFDFERKLALDHTLKFSAGVSDIKYSDPLNDSRESYVSAQYGFLLSRELAWTFGAGYRTRDSVTSARDFSETTVFTNLELNRLTGKTVRP